MGDRLNELIRRIVAGSVTTLIAASPGAAASNKNPAVAPSTTAKSEAMGPTHAAAPFILKQASNVGEYHTSHRSHRSHSSHSSHYSSRGGGAVTPPTPRPLVARTDSLGSRTLIKGMRGADVGTLMLLLVREGSLRADDLNSTQLYTDKVEQAVRAFQRKRGLQADGIANSSVFLRLKSYVVEAPIVQADATRVDSLGSRSLSIGAKGRDVNELMLLLVREGSLKVEHINTEQLFTREVENAVKVFQVKNQLTADGLVGPLFILQLKRTK